jgi:hypothetical protein
VNYEGNDVIMIMNEASVRGLLKKRGYPVADKLMICKVFVMYRSNEPSLSK